MIIALLALSVVLNILTIGLLAYIVKTVVDEQPIMIDRNTKGTEVPEIVTRASLRAERAAPPVDNLKKDEPQYADLADLPPEMGMEELDKHYRGEK